MYCNTITNFYEHFPHSMVNVHLGRHFDSKIMFNALVSAVKMPRQLLTSRDLLFCGGDSPLTGERGRFPGFKILTGCNTT